MKHTPQSLSRRVVRSGVDWSGAGQTLSGYLASRFPYRDAEAWKEIIRAKIITVNGKACQPETILNLHDVVEYFPGELAEPPADLNYKVVFEDDSLLVIDKPGNLCMHPAGPFFKHTLWHLLCSKYGEIHFINRLDRETSGLLIAAKNADTARCFGKRELIREKCYQVLIYGRFEHAGTVSGFLYSDPASCVRKKRKFSFEAPDFPAESARTDFELLNSDGRYSLLRAELHTGRMHQIRATLCSLGYPVVGDKLYGPDEEYYLKQKNELLTAEDRKKLVLPHQALHSCFLAFEHPEKGDLLSFESEAPFADLTEIP